MLTPPQIKGVNLADELAVIFTPKGELLWLSDFWVKMQHSEHQAPNFMGYRWQEFVFQEDLAPLRKWLKNPLVPETEFRAMLPPSGVLIHVAFHKLRYGPNWLCIGTIWPIAGDSAQPCAIVRTKRAH